MISYECDLIMLVGALFGDVDSNMGQVSKERKLAKMSKRLRMNEYKKRNKSSAAYTQQQCYWYCKKGAWL